MKPDNVFTFFHGGTEALMKLDLGLHLLASAHLHETLLVDHFACKNFLGLTTHKLVAPRKAALLITYHTTYLPEELPTVVDPLTDRNLILS